MWYNTDTVIGNTVLEMNKSPQEMALDDFAKIINYTALPMLDWFEKV